MKKVLVIGGNRYFGKRLVNLLLENGDQVTVLNRGNVKNTFGNRITQLIADRTEPIALAKAVGDSTWDLIYDQCCQSPNEAKIACDIFAGKAKRYVFTSSQSIYLESKVDLSESEFAAEHETYQLGSTKDFPYAQCKRFAESVFFQNVNFPVVAVRIPIILGPDDYTKRLEFHIDRVRAGLPMVIENPSAQLSLMSSEDASKFLLNLADIPFVGPINASSLGNPEIGEIIEMIESALGKKAILQTSGEDSDYTPFVGAESKTMSLERALGLGFQFSSVKDWLPGLIRHYH